MQDPITITMERELAEDLFDVLESEVIESDEYQSIEETMDDGATTISEALANQ